MRFRRDADKDEPSIESIVDDEEEYDLENENSDRPKTKRETVDYVGDLHKDVHALNYDLK